MEPDHPVLDMANAHQAIHASIRDNADRLAAEKDGNADKGSHSPLPDDKVNQ